MLTSRLPWLLRRAGERPLLAVAAFALAAGAQFWASRVGISTDWGEPLPVSAGETLTLRAVGSDARLLSLEVRGSLDVRADQAQLAPQSAALLALGGLQAPSGDGPIAWLSTSGAAAPSLLEIRRVATEGPATLRLRPLPSPDGAVLRLEVEADAPLSVTLGAGEVGTAKRLTVGEQSLAVDGALPLQLALPAGQPLRFNLDPAERDSPVALTAGTLRESGDALSGLPVAFVAIGSGEADVPPTLAACAAPPRAWLWQGTKGVSRGACPTAPPLAFRSLTLAPAHLAADLAGHAWRWEDGRLAGGSLLSRLLAQPAGLTLLGLVDGLLALWLAVALVSWRRQGRYRVFISYRRGDTAGHAGRLRDSLEEVLGQNAVFLDLSNLAPGTPFARALEGRIRAAECVLVVIGRDWLTATDEGGKRRLDDAGDWVRREIEIGLARNKRLIPVLVAGAEMPEEAALPVSLRPLAGRHAFVIEEAHFQRDAEALADVIETPATPAAGVDATLNPAGSKE